MVWAIAGAMAAVGGLLLAPIALVDISLWYVVLKALQRWCLEVLARFPARSSADC